MKLLYSDIKDFFKSLIQNNSGHSSKSAAFLAGVGVSCFCVLLITFYLGYDMFIDGKIDTDMLGVSALIASYAAFSVSVAHPKTSSEKKEINNQNNNNIK